MLAEALLGCGKDAPQAWNILMGRRSRFSGCRGPWTRAGSHRFPGDPSRAFALILDPGRAGETSPMAVPSMLPPIFRHRRPQRSQNIEADSQGFSIRRLRFTSHVAVAHARLASGWRAAPLPGGRRTPWIALKGFWLHLRPPFQVLTCRDGNIRESNGLRNDEPQIPCAKEQGIQFAIKGNSWRETGVDPESETLRFR